MIILSTLIILIGITAVTATILYLRFDVQRNYSARDRASSVVAICLLLMLAILILNEVGIDWRIL